ncbi:MAG: MBL fold metallo-hydrolase [Akkermansiaceae bacterium]|nr:MBL fold metallo-hydrolase [Akkermansiaceae bacterium]
MAAELVQVSELTYYLPGPTQVGLVRLGGDEVCLIDSGGDKSAGRALRRLIEQRGWRLRAIFNTHSHADHIGGNQYLQARTGCRIYAPGIESAFTRYPSLEPLFLYGGNPGRALRSKFLQAAESAAEPLCPEDLPEGFRAIPLPGHSFDMVGYLTPDGVFFAADALAAPETLAKHRVWFLCDPAAHLHTLRQLPQIEARLVIPSHAAPAADIRELARLNQEAVHSVADTICAICRAGALTHEDITARMAGELGLQLSPEQHALLGCTLRSYLSWLRDSGKLCAAIVDNRLIWNAEA